MATPRIKNVVEDFMRIFWAITVELDTMNVRQRIPNGTALEGGIASHKSC